MRLLKYGSRTIRMTHWHEQICPKWRWIHVPDDVDIPDDILTYNRQNIHHIDIILDHVTTKSQNKNTIINQDVNALKDLPQSNGTKSRHIRKLRQIQTKASARRSHRSQKTQLKESHLVQSESLVTVDSSIRQQQQQQQQNWMQFYDTWRHKFLIRNQCKARLTQNQTSLGKKEHVLYLWMYKCFHEYRLVRYDKIKRWMRWQVTKEVNRGSAGGGRQWKINRKHRERRCQKHNIQNDIMTDTNGIGFQNIVKTVHSVDDVLQELED
jgi:hypothetical protein